MTEDITVPIVDNDDSFEDNTGEETPASSPEVDEKETEKEEAPSSEGDDNSQDDPDKDVPFHEHSRWKDREKDWNKRFNDQETRHQDELKDIRKEFSNARKENAEKTEIPSWFGGDQEAWDKYSKYEDAKLKKAEERAVAKFKSERENEGKARQEATEYMKSEISEIESDKKLNPDSLKINQNKLLKIVVDNNLVDLKGHWNYRAAWKILKSQTKPTAKKSNKDRKKVAGALGSDSKPEKKAVPYKTNEDFQRDRPW